MAVPQPVRAPRSREPNPTSQPARNVVVAGRRTSVRLEPVMWEALNDIARQQRVGVNDLVTDIARRRDITNLTAAIRVYIVNFYRSAAAASGVAIAAERRSI